MSIDHTRLDPTALVADLPFLSRRALTAIGRVLHERHPKQIRLTDVARLSRRDFWKVKNCGETSVNNIERVLRMAGLSLQPDPVDRRLLVDVLADMKDKAKFLAESMDTINRLHAAHTVLLTFVSLLETSMQLADAKLGSVKLVGRLDGRRLAEVYFQACGILGRAPYRVVEDDETNSEGESPNE